MYFDSSANAYRYRVSTKSDIIKLAILFNGKLATINKINQLEKWVKVLNKDSVKLIFNSNPFMPTLNDSWLSGFTTAEGSFIVGIVNQKSKKEVVDSEGNLGVKEVISQLVRIRFVLEQFLLYPGLFLSSAVFRFSRQSPRGLISRSLISSFTRKLSTSANGKLPSGNPMWITGFVEGEGSFMVRVFKEPGMYLGWRVAAIFSITLHQKDRAILELIKSYFGAGNIYKNGLTKVQFKVTSINELESLIRHFDSYPLITQKLADYPLGGYLDDESKGTFNGRRVTINNKY